MSPAARLAFCVWAHVAVIWGNDAASNAGTYRELLEDEHSAADASAAILRHSAGAAVAIAGTRRRLPALVDHSWYVDG
jgi:hypothetical protein